MKTRNSTKKVIVSMLVCLSICLATCWSMLSPAAVVQTKADGQDGAASLMEENFFYFGNDTVLSGWIVDSTGGSIASSTANGLTMKDESSEAAVQLRKEFVKQENRDIVVETNIKRVGNFSVTFMVMTGDKPLIKVGTMGKYVGYCAPDGSFVTMWKYSKACRLKMVIHLAQQKYDIYQDGKLMLTDLPFFTKSNSADGVLIRTSTEEKGSATVETVRVYTGYQVKDSFTTVGNGVLPDGWTIKGNGKATTVSQTAHGAADAMVLRLQSTDAESAATGIRAFEKTTKKSVVEFMLKTNSATNGTCMRIMNGSATVMEMLVKDGVWSFKGAEGFYKEMTYAGNAGKQFATKHRPNTWYKFRLVLDNVSGKADIYCNYKKIASNVKVVTGGIDALQFETAVGSDADLWLEDVQVYDYTELAKDYVAKPIVPKKASDVQVGMQYFGGWQIGTHVGWDTVSYQSAMDMPIGYYDEGNTELWDWQIKYMVEHGVDFVFMDWYENYEFNGTDPLVEPMYSHALDGYFYSEYSNYLKFAFQIVGPYYSMENYKNNIIPYWVQYYFTDPRYEVIDNKPVLGWFEPKTIADTLGGVDKLKELMGYIEQACIDAGFDGVYFVANQNTGFSNITEADFDGMYWYALGNISWKKMIEKQESAQEEIKNTNTDIVPTLSVGWSDEVWHMDGVNTSEPIDNRMNPTDFDKLCKWGAKYSAEMPENSIGNKMVLIDNWNEYSEGHSMMPTYKRGFGYLNAIGQSFTTVKDFSSINISPTEKQKARLNTQYPKTWHGRVWEFDAGKNVTEFWSSGFGVVDFKADGQGHLSGLLDSAEADTAYVQSPPEQNISAANNKIVIGLKNDSDVTGLKIYFTTDKSSSFSEDKCFNIALHSQDEYYSNYVIDASSNKNWNGTIRQLRLKFVFANNTIGGNFMIDYVRVLSNTSLESTPLLGKKIEKLNIPFQYEFLEAAEYYSKPMYQAFGSSASVGTKITLKVSVTGRPISGYTIKLDGANPVKLISGKCTYYNVPLGYHTLSVYDQDGVQTARKSFNISVGDKAGYADGMLTVTQTEKIGNVSMTLSSLPANSIPPSVSSPNETLDVSPEENVSSEMVSDDAETSSDTMPSNSGSSLSASSQDDSRSTNTMGIIAGVGIGLGGLVITGVVLFFILHKKKQEHPQ